MTAKLQKTAACLCKKVTIEANAVDPNMGACHCNMCQKISSGPYLAIDCGQDVTITKGEEFVKTYNSSSWAERAFCSECGSALFYRLKENNQHMLSAGLFDQQDDFTFDHQIFIEEKPNYYNFANDTKNMTGEEVFAAFSE